MSTLQFLLPDAAHRGRTGLFLRSARSVLREQGIDACCAVVTDAADAAAPIRGVALARGTGAPAQLLVDSRRLRIVADDLRHASLRPVVLAQQT